MDESDLMRHGVRVRRLRELDQSLRDLGARMRDTMGRINELVGRTAGPGLPKRSDGHPAPALRARIHVTSGMLAVRYEVGARSAGNLTTRSMIVEADPSGSGLRWRVAVPQEKQQDLLELDQRRRILNHLYRTTFSERRSLRRLHDEERSLKAGSSQPAT